MHVYIAAVVVPKLATVGAADTEAVDSYFTAVFAANVSSFLSAHLCPKFAAQLASLIAALGPAQRRA